MAAPQYVPVNKNVPTRKYTSTKRLEEGWSADRDTELVGFGQPYGDHLGVQGPDLGYALKLAKTFTDELNLDARESSSDVISGVAAIAMKRAALFGRAPVIHDVKVALGLWGFLDPAGVPADVLDARVRLFAGVANPHHYHERRWVADAISAETLAAPLDRIDSLRQGVWQELVALSE